jgi:hypothetical protein
MTVTGERTGSLATASFWQAVGGALATMARRAGCSLRDSPLPEIREVAHELGEWHRPPPGGHQG